MSHSIRIFLVSGDIAVGKSTLIDAMEADYLVGDETTATTVGQVFMLAFNAKASVSIVVESQQPTENLVPMLREVARELDDVTFRHIHISL